MKSTPAPAGPTLRGNFLWALAGNLVNGACGWGLYVVLARLGTPEMVGLYAVGAAVVTPIGLLGDLHLRATLGTDARRQFPFCDYLGLRCATLLGQFVLVPLAAVVAGYPEPTVAVIVAVGVARSLESLFDLCYGLLQQHERMDRVTRSLLLRGPLTLALVAAAVALTHSALGGVAALCVGRAVALLGHDLPVSAAVLRASGGDEPLATRLWPRWHGPSLARLAGLTLPIGVVMMLIALNASIPVLVVQHVCGPHDVGLFSALVTLTGAGALIATAAGQAISPRLAAHYAAGELAGFRALLRNAVLLAAGVGAAGVIGALLVGGPFLRLVYGPEYAAHTDLLAWLMGALALDYATSLLGWGILATRQFGRYPLPYLLTTAVAAVAAGVLVPRFGLLGAAWAVCVVNLASVAVLGCILALALADAAPAARV
jgi:O-antigen/teichoic acid export membrane protein